MATYQAEAALPEEAYQAEAALPEREAAVESFDVVSLAPACLAAVALTAEAGYFVSPALTSGEP